MGILPAPLYLCTNFTKYEAEQAEGLRILEDEHEKKVLTPDADARLETPPSMKARRSTRLDVLTRKLASMHEYAKKLENASFDPKEAGLLEVVKRPNPPKPTVRKRKLLAHISRSITLNDLLGVKRARIAENEAKKAKISNRRLAQNMRKQHAIGALHELYNRIY